MTSAFCCNSETLEFVERNAVFEVFVLKKTAFRSTNPRVSESRQKAEVNIGRGAVSRGENFEVKHRLVLQVFSGFDFKTKTRLVLTFTTQLLL